MGFHCNSIPVLLSNYNGRVFISLSYNALIFDISAFLSFARGCCLAGYAIGLAAINLFLNPQASLLQLADPSDRDIGSTRVADRRFDFRLRASLDDSVLRVYCIPRPSLRVKIYIIFQNRIIIYGILALCELLAIIKVAACSFFKN